ncbi:PREDICTED: inactive serine protease 35-like, partial [Cyprinodon variegatus]|uniref:inactive serine protease 35-like n=1 Tax=Cyprinodon variegatus TaxID=28743 RepID=UPI00074251B4
MGLKLMFMLLFAANLAVLGLFGDDGESISNRWTRQTLPRLLVKHKASLDNSLFRGQRGEKVEARNSTLCGIECQGSLSSVNKTEQQRILGYETLYNNNGTRVHTDVSLHWMNEAPGGATSRTDLHIRRKRQVYGGDGRFVISDPNFITNYPFSTAVRISTGCSGVLVSPKHVLTAAHCIHDGRDYLQSTRSLRVGL